MPYRGDDTRLNVWQRLLMLFVGIGGLWFIPTFHNISKLSPFLGALCVLSVLWIVNEIFNRKLMNMDAMVDRRTPRVLQYGVIQMILFVMGIMLAVGVVKETGAYDELMEYLGVNDPAKTINDAADYEFGISQSYGYEDTKEAIDDINKNLGSDISTKEYDTALDMVCIGGSLPSA